MNSYSIFLGKPFGIPTRIHWTFWILILWIVYTNSTQGQSGTEILWYVGFIFSIFTCVVLHELGHALAAKRYGIQTRSITIFPIGGVASLEKMPEKPVQELIVAIAGPMVNVVIAGFLWVLLGTANVLSLNFEDDIAALTSIDGSNFFIALMFINIALVVFNMIPAFPMDGGRVLRSLLAMKFSRVQATEWAVKIGSFFAILFVFWGFSSNPFLIFIALFISLSAQGELEMVKSQSFLSDHRINDVVMKNFTVLEQNQPLSSAVQALLDGQEKQFLVSDGTTISGVLTKNDIIRGLTELDDLATVGQIAQKGIMWVNEGDLIHDIRNKMMSKGITILPVGEPNQFSGVVDLDNINEFLLIKQARISKTS